MGLELPARKYMFITTTQGSGSGLARARFCFRRAQRIRMLVTILFCSWVSVFCVGKGHALDLTSFVGGLVPGQEMLWMYDADGRFSFDEARLQLQTLGQAETGSGHPNLGYRRGALWVKLELTNRITDESQWVAFTNFTKLARIDFYYQNADGVWQTRAAGNSLPFRDRDLMHRSINFKFAVFPGQVQTLYFRVESSGSLQFPLVVGSEEHFFAAAERSLLMAGLFYGSMLMIGLYSFSVWYSSRETGFLYFGILVLFGGFHSLASQGLAYQFLWPDSSVWASSDARIISLMACAAGMTFVRTFLGLHSLNVRLDIAAKYYTIAAGVAIVVGLISEAYITSRLALVFIFVWAGLVTLSSYLAHRKQIREASYFVSAWVMLLLGVFLEVVQRLGVNVPPLLAYNSIELSSLMAISVLALGLSDRLQGMVEGYRASQEAILRANQLKIDALQQAGHVKEEFIANVSHELRTPLTGIIGLAEIMLTDKSGGNLNVSQRETLTLMKVSAQRLSSLVNDVIDFSAMKNGQLSLNKRDVDLKQVCSLVVRMTRPLVGDKPINLVETYPGLKVLVEGDADRLQQILFNLVANAVKFTPRGTVTISIELLEDNVRVSVRDTGIGISATEQKNIFKRFYQVDSDETRQAGGTGLGLSITQRLLEMHDSEISLHSAPGVGSVFYFDLPVKESMPEGPRTSAGTPSDGTESAIDTRALISLDEALYRNPLAEERRKGGRADDENAVAANNRRDWTGRILVVDDEYLNLRIVESHLSESYQLTTASSGAEALEKLGQEKPDLIILDLMMPVMSGYQVCQIIRKRYDVDELPIVILTAKNRVEDMVKGLSLGANDYLTKPFSKEELRVRVDKQFELLHLQAVRRDNRRLNWQLLRYEESEKRLRAREQHLAALLDVTGDPLLAVDEVGQLIFINHAAGDLLQIQAGDYVHQSINVLSDQMLALSPAVAQAIHFPFNEAMISSKGKADYYDFDLPGGKGRFCLLTMSQLDQEFYLIVFERDCSSTMSPSLKLSDTPDVLTLPQIIDEINRNVERAQVLGGYLQQIKPEDLHKHRDLVEELGNFDSLINRLAGTISTPIDEESDLQYREALVKVMQDCHYYWQKVTGESIIELAEQSRIWSVSIDNGRLRTRSMNRYLSLDKLPSNPRWRQVARTAYFVLSKVSRDEEARKALETSAARLQEIVEHKALT